MDLARAKASVMFLLLAGYLILGYSFMQLRIPPSGSGVPLAEAMLLILLLTINHFRLVPKMGWVVPLLPFLVWWATGVVRAFSGFADHGMWALRDASQVFESMYIIVGFAMAGNVKVLRSLFRFMPLLILAYLVYALGYPLRDQLEAFMYARSLIVVGGSGQEIPIAFTYSPDIMGIMFLWSAVYFILYYDEPRLSNKALSALAGVVVLYAITMLQARTVYLHIIILFLIFMAFNRSSLRRVVKIIPILALVGTLVLMSGIKITGRLGQEISIDFFLDHFAAIFGVASDKLEAPAEGVGLRLGWWLGIYERWSASMGTMLFGLGYGLPLVDYRYIGNVTVREPHNSFISIFGRLGLVGGFAWVAMHVAMISAWHKAITFCRRAGLVEPGKWLLLFLTFFAMVWVLCIGEDGLEKPYVAVPYYFFWGVVLRLAYFCKTAAATERAERSPETALAWRPAE